VTHRSLAFDQRFKCRQPTLVIWPIGIVLDFAAKTLGPFAPGEQAMFVERYGQSKSFGLPGGIEYPLGVRPGITLAQGMAPINRYARSRAT